MGLDGGTKITRSDVLRGQSWRLSQADSSRSTRGGCVSSSDVYQQERQEQEAARVVQWTTCSLSGEPLESNRIVADYLGNLYNKAAFLEFVLGKNGVFENEGAKHRFANTELRGQGRFKHLKRSADVFDVNGTRQAVRRAPDSPEEIVFMCPITDLSCLRCPFSALATCGHLVSDRAIREMSDGCCPICNKAFQQDDVIPVNGSDHQVERLKERLQGRRKRGKSKKRKATVDQEKNLSYPLKEQKLTE